MGQVCQVSEELLGALKSFRFKKTKTIDALIMKINIDSLSIELDEKIEDTTLEDLAEDLPTAEPRYILLSYVRNFDDGRQSFPLIFIFYTPPGAQPTLRMVYSTSKLTVEKAANPGKAYEVRSEDEMTTEWLEENLAKA